MQYETFATKMEDYMASFEKEFPGSTPALVRQNSEEYYLPAFQI